MHLYIGVFSCLVCICVAHPHNDTWDHSDHGETWRTKFKDFCAGKKQSPINIINPQCDKALNDSITFINYGNAGPTKFPLENNGRWLIVRAASTTAKIKLGGPATYRFHQLHFHWGKDDTRGSEHQLDGKVFPAAMHLYHINEKYSSFHGAQGKKDGFAMLSFFVKIGEKNPAFDFLNFTTYNKLIDSETKVNITQFALDKLLPKNLTVFYRYEGSITNPTCDESILWTIFDQPVYISKSQLAELRRLKDSANKTLVDNYRAVQDLNGRKITYWSEAKCASGDSGATALGASIFAALFSLLLFTLFINVS